jgi:hypothetical protein
MKSKQIIIVGTMVLVLSIGGGIWNDSAIANAASLLFDKSKSCSVNASALLERNKKTGEADLTQVLGMTGEEIQQSLYDGNSLADMAESNNVDVQQVVDLQTAELNEQLKQRLLSGGLTTQQYRSLQSELKTIISSSVYG